MECIHWSFVTCSVSPRRVQARRVPFLPLVGLWILKLPGVTRCIQHTCIIQHHFVEPRPEIVKSPKKRSIRGTPKNPWFFWQSFISESDIQHVELAEVFCKSHKKGKHIYLIWKDVVYQCYQFSLLLYSVSTIFRINCEVLQVRLFVIFVLFFATSTSFFLFAAETLQRWWCRPFSRPEFRHFLEQNYGGPGGAGRAWRVAMDVKVAARSETLRVVELVAVSVRVKSQCL